MRLGKTVPDSCQQRIWRERLAQAARGAELKRHPQEVGRGEYGADFLWSFEFLVSVIQSLHHGARRSPFACIEMVMTARTVGLVPHANGINAGSAARPRNGARQLLTAEKNRREKKVVRTGGRPKDMRMQCLPSIARFRLMKAPLPLIPG